MGQIKLNDAHVIPFCSTSSIISGPVEFHMTRRGTEATKSPLLLFFQLFMSLLQASFFAHCIRQSSKEQQIQREGDSHNEFSTVRTDLLTPSTQSLSHPVVIVNHRITPNLRPLHTVPGLTSHEEQEWDNRWKETQKAKRQQVQMKGFECGQ